MHVKTDLTARAGAVFHAVEGTIVKNVLKLKTDL